MIRLGLRLAVASGREAVTRLVIIAVAVALGVGLLLATLAAINAVNAQNARYAWLNTSPRLSQAVTGSGAAAGTGTGDQRTADPLWWLVRRDFFDGQTIGRVEVAATGPSSPVPPGISRLPGPGEFYASPALSALLASTPAAELGDRFPGRQIGTIGSAALPSPKSLLIIIGRSPDQLSHVSAAAQVTHINALTPSNCDGCDIGVRTAGLELILSVVAAALLFPVLIFIGASTRLAAARREQRFAAMRLLGATPRQISVIAAVESTAAAIAGMVAGFGLFFLIRGPLAGINFTGATFADSDLSLNAADVALVALCVPFGAAVAARIALRRVRISPLGVTRRVTPRPPRVYRLIPLLAGVAELVYFVGRVPQTSTGQVAAFLPGFLVIMAGLVIAGPWLTMVGSRVLARRSSRPATLIAARRLADNPTAAFRAISGLVLGLFVTTVATAVITTIVDNRGSQRDGAAATVLSMNFSMRATAALMPDSVVADLSSIPGVVNVAPIHSYLDGPPWMPPGVIACSDLVRTPELGRCANGAVAAAVWSDFVGPGGNAGPATVWPTPPLTIPELQRLPIMTISVETDGSTTALERARTVLEGAYPQAEPPATDDDFGSDTTSNLAGWQQLANAVILASLPIAGCSLAVSVAGGLTERKRPFSLLRLSGVPLRLLRRIVAMESAVPLLVVAAVSIGAGLLSAQLFLRAQMGYTLRPLGVGYYVIVAVGLVASLGIIGSTLPLLKRMTGPETARNE